MNTSKKKTSSKLYRKIREGIHEDLLITLKYNRSLF